MSGADKLARYAQQQATRLVRPRDRYKVKIALRKAMAYALREAGRSDWSTRPTLERIAKELTDGK